MAKFIPGIYNNFYYKILRYFWGVTWFVATKQLDIAQQLPFCFLIVISSSLCSVFVQKLQNTIKRRIRPFFSDNSVNLALKVYKTHGNTLQMLTKFTLITFFFFFFEVAAYNFKIYLF